VMEVVDMNSVVVELGEDCFRFEDKQGSEP